MRRYAWLLGVVLVVGVVLAAVSRGPRGDSRAVPAASAPPPEISVRLEIRGDSISPALVRVPKGNRVALFVVNTGHTTAKLSLPGYEDRLAPITLVSGGSWTGSFLADRPGDDFAWMLNGQPAARLDVEGSHLVDGHR